MVPGGKNPPGDHKGWNPLNKTPLSSWLSSSQGPAEKARLHTLGNCIVPRMAEVALFHLNQLIQMHPLE